MTTIIYLDEYQIFILSAVQAEFEDSSIGDYVTQSFTADSVTFFFETEEKPLVVKELPRRPET